MVPRNPVSGCNLDLMSGLFTETWIGGAAAGVGTSIGQCLRTGHFAATVSAFIHID
ncbi:hypothetical protein AA0498_0467 [Acidomonas methanolica]|nr:hypothetical protein AA0498_0467 [Acidomonas methanolica]